MSWLLLFGVLIAAHTIPHSHEQVVAGPVRVYVGIPTRDGFVDASQGVADSVKDIVKRIERVPFVVLSHDAESADLRLWVVDRGVGSEAYGSRATVLPYFNGAVLQETKTYANTYWVAAILEVGGYRKELVGDYTHGMAASFGAWSEAAKELTAELEFWVQANRARLVEMRKASSPMSAPSPQPSAPVSGAMALALADPNAKWNTTLPGATALISPLPDGKLRVVLDGALSMKATLTPDGPSRFVGVVDDAPACALAPPEVTLTDEADGWTGRTTIYDCAAVPPTARRTAFRIIK